MTTPVQDSVLCLTSDQELLAHVDLPREPGELVAPFFRRASDGGLALIRKLGERYQLAFYTVQSGRPSKVGEVTQLDELEDARVIAREELMLSLSQPRSFRWAKLKDDVAILEGEAISAESDAASGASNRLPEGLLVKFVEAGSEAGKIVVEAQAKPGQRALRFEVSKRLLNLL